jgi:hypothetical protein
MIGRWLRRCWWTIEDTLTDVLDWSPRPAPQLTPLPPPAPSEQPKYVPFNFVGVTFQRADAESVDAEWTREIMAKLAAGHFVEIQW